MTDWFGPWDVAYLLLIVAVMVAGLRRIRRPQPERYLGEQMRRVYALKNRDAGVKW